MTPPSHPLFAQLLAAMALQARLAQLPQVQSFCASGGMKVAAAGGCIRLTGICKVKQVILGDRKPDEDLMM